MASDEGTPRPPEADACRGVGESRIREGANPRLAHIKAALRSVERAEAEEQWALVCFLAGRGVELDPEVVNGTVRRAELLLATGGDPHRALELYGRAVSAVARDLDSPAARAQLRAGLASLQADATGLRGVGEALRLLLADTDLAWQCFAMSLLAEELAEAS